MGPKKKRRKPDCDLTDEDCVDDIFEDEPESDIPVHEKRAKMGKRKMI